MNINYGDTGIMVNYLQYFLRDNYSNTTRLSWIYDEYTHKKFIEYLDLPNAIYSNTLVEYLKSLRFSAPLEPDLRVLAEPFNAMQCHIEDDIVVFLMKDPKSIEGYNPDSREDELKVKRFKAIIPILKTLYNDVVKITEEYGWRVAEYPDLYRNIDVTNWNDIVDLESVLVVLKKQTPTNIFPHFDIRYMINYFNNDYVNNYLVSNSYFQKSSNYRVGFVECNSGDKFIIAHNYTYSIPIKIGYCELKKSDIIDKLYTSSNLASIQIRGMDDEPTKVIPGVPILAEIPESENGYKTMLILIPNTRYTKQFDEQSQIPLSFVDTEYLVGDLNDDGEIDEIDRLIYSCQRPNDMGYDDFYYFNQNYDRYANLCKCIEEKYKKLFLSNVNEYHEWKKSQYNNEELYYLDSGGYVYYNIDTIVQHLRFLCSGSDVVFTRYLINGMVNYKITIGNNQSAINMEILNSYNDGRGFPVSSFDNYLGNLQSDTLENYIYDTDVGTHAVSSNSNSVGLKLVCGSEMTTNNLLVIKTNPYDNITDCSKILNGSHNSEDGTLSLPISDFKGNPWMVREEIFTALLDMLINPYSNQEDINFVYKLISEQNGTGEEFSSFKFPDRYVYCDELKQYIKELQIINKSNFSLGYFDMTAYSVLYDLAYQNYLNKQVESIREDMGEEQ